MINFHLFKIVSTKNFCQMDRSRMQTCSALIHKFEPNVCSFRNSFETEPPTHLHIEVKNEEEEEERKKKNTTTK